MVINRIDHFVLTVAERHFRFFSMAGYGDLDLEHDLADMR